MNEPLIPTDHHTILHLLAEGEAERQWFIFLIRDQSLLPNLRAEGRMGK